MLRLIAVSALLACVLCRADGYWTPPDGMFPILGWVNPPGNFTNQDRYDEYAEAGFTLVDCCSDAAVPFAKQAGMWVFNYLGIPDPDTPEGRARIDAVLAKWKDEPRSLGYHLMDEPNARVFPLLARISRYVEERDPEAVCFTNLFPNYANSDQLGAPTYAEHVEQYMTVVKPKVLCFDHYPLVGATAVRGNYYENLEIIREASLRHSTPFWAFALTCPHGPYRNPTEAEIRFQVYSDIVYGAKGTFYFTYWTPVDPAWNFHNAIIDLDGSRTEHYEQVKRINAKLKGWGPVLLKLTSDSVCHVGDVPAGVTACPEDLARGGSFVLGRFTHEDGSRWLMVMNKDMQSTQTLSLSLPAGTVLREWSWETGDLLAPVTDCAESGGKRVFQISVEAGDAGLFRVD